MTLLTDPIAQTPTVSCEGSGLSPVASLDPFLYRDPRWCAVCEREEEFREFFVTDLGRVGVCLGCGDERVIPFSRTNSEAC